MIGPCLASWKRYELLQRLHFDTIRPRLAQSSQDLSTLPADHLST